MHADRRSGTQSICEAHMNTYLLVDASLIDKKEIIPVLADGERPSWILPIYQESAYLVTPLLIDMGEVVACEATHQLMPIWNACKPQLHISIISSDISFAQLLNHFKNFIYVRTSSNDFLTFRFADCAVLACLQFKLAAPHWLAMTKPMSRWVIHGRDGSLNTLLLPDKISEISATPLVLEDQQIHDLKEFLSADRLIFQLRNIRSSEFDTMDSVKLYAWVQDALSMWAAAGLTDQSILIDFALGVIDTEGRILRMKGMAEILAQPSLQLVREEMHKAIVRNTFRNV